MEDDELYRRQMVLTASFLQTLYSTPTLVSDPNQVTKPAQEVFQKLWGESLRFHDCGVW